MSDFTFNGISASSMGLRIERFPVMPKPRKRMTAISIPGRSGDLHQWDGSYEDIVIRYQCWYKSKPASDQAHKTAEWLYAAPAGARLEDTYDAQVYREATFIGPMDVENVLDRHGRLVIEFKCAPQAYLKLLENGWLMYAPGGAVENTTPFETRPLLSVTGRVSGTVTIGDNSITILFNSSTSDRTIWVDCDTLESWSLDESGAEVSTNNLIFSSKFPTIQPGRNEIRMTGGVKSVTVWPRMFTL